MTIEVLGAGCARCTTLYENAKKALEESGRNGELVKIEDITSMVKYGIMSLPALVIDGQVKISGKLASVAEIKGLLQCVTNKPIHLAARGHAQRKRACK